MCSSPSARRGLSFFDDADATLSRIRIGFPAQAHNYTISCLTSVPVLEHFDLAETEAAVKAGDATHLLKMSPSSSNFISFRLHFTGAADFTMQMPLLLVLG